MKKLKAKKNEDGIEDVSCEELCLHLSDVKLIDVRRPEEFSGELGHIAGAQLSTLETNFLVDVKELAKLKKTIVFVCRSGGRSCRAAQLALENGCSQVYNLEGGMLKWNDLDFPTEL